MVKEQKVSKSQYKQLPNKVSKPTPTRVLLRHTLARMWMRVFVALLTMVVLTSVVSITRTSPPVVNAAAPTTLNFQARLLNSSGSLVADGTYNVEFKLYNASSSSGSSQGSCTGDAACLWTETRTAGNKIQVKNGYLSAYLGDVTSLPTNIWNQQLWLTMNIGGTGAPGWDGEMTPRIRLTSVPFAFRATVADSAETLSKNTGSFTGTVDFSNLTADRTYLFPDTSLATTGSPGTICVYNGAASNCPAAAGSAYYIQNDTVVQTQTNFNIQARDSGANGTIGGVIRGAANGQTVDLMQFQASAGSVLAAVTAAGNLQVASSLDTRAAGTLSIGDSTATSISVCNSASCDTVNVATNTDADTVNVGDSLDTLNFSGTAINFTGGQTTIQTSTDNSSAFVIRNQDAEDVLVAGTSDLYTNLIPNSSFESGVSGWASKGGAGAPTQSTAQKLYGANSMSFTTTGANQGASYDVTLTPSTQYTLTAFVRISTGTVSAFIMGRQDVSGTNVNCAVQTATNSGWYRLNCTFTTGATITAPSSIYIMQNDAVARTIYIDGIGLHSGVNQSGMQPSTGTLQVSSVITAPVAIRSVENTNFALNVANAAGASVFTIDTVNSGLSILGTASSSSAGTGFSAVGTSTGSSFNAAGTSITTGNGFLFNTTANGFTTGKALNVTGAASAITADFSGAYLNVTPTRTLTAAATRTDSGQFLNLVRSNTVNNAGATYNITGALANLQSTCTQTAGTCNDSSNILNLNQQYTASTGAVLNLTGAGTGNLGVLDTTNASANGVSIDIQSSNAGQYVFKTTSNNGATTSFQVNGDGSIAAGASGTNFTVNGALVVNENVTINGNTTLGNAVTDTTDITGSLATKRGADYTTAGSANNVDFGGASLVRLDTSGAAQTITGIAGGRDGFMLTLVNADASANVTLSNDSGSSSAANRITTGTGADLILPAGASTTLIYDSGASLWRIVGGVATTGGGANQQLSNLSGTVAVNLSLLANADNTLDLGSTAASWRTLYADTSVLTAAVDYIGGGSGTLAVGNGATTTAVSLCNSATCDTIQIANNADADSLTVGDSLDTVGINGTVTVTGATSILGGTLNLNVSSNNTTNINTGTSTGAISIGNSAAGAIALQSGTSVGVTGVTNINVNANNATNINTGTSTGLVTIGGGSGTFSLQTTNIDISSAGAITGATGFTFAAGAYNFDQSASSGTFASGTGTATFNGDVVVAAGKSLTITGGNTASRPASPTEGMLYFDTTTKSLLTYSNGKWQADRSTATKTVAPSTASQAIKDSADYVADGTADQTEINSALTAAAGGKVYLFEGTFTTDDVISIPNNTTLSGAGRGTLIQFANIAGQTKNMITNTDTTTGTGVVIRDVRLDGDKATNTTGTMYGIYLEGMGSQSGSRQGGIVTNTWISNFISDGIRLNTSSYNNITNNTLQANTGNGIYIGNGRSNVVTNNILFGMTGHGIWLSASFFTMVANNNVVSSGSSGIRITSGTDNTITSNNLKDNTASTAHSSIYVNDSDRTHITSNTITDTAGTGYAIEVNDAASDNTYLSDNIYSGTGASSISDAGTNTIYAGQSNGSSYLLTPQDDFAITGNAASTVSTTAGDLTIQAGSGTVSLGSSTNLVSSGALSIRSGGANTLTVDTGGAATLNLGTTNANAVSISRTGITTTVNGALTVTQATTLNGGLTISNGGNVAFQRGTDFSTTGTSNNVDFGTGALFRLTGASAQTITGIAGGTDGRIITLMNIGANTATLSNNSGSSSAANRIITGTGSDLSILTGASVELAYDSGASLWRVIGAAAGGAGANTALSNLSSVAINTSLLTGADNTIDLGSAAFSWRSLYADTSVLTPTVDVSAAGTLSLGTTTATAITLGRSGAEVTVDSTRLSVNGNSITNSKLVVGGALNTTTTSSVYGIQNQFSVNPSGGSLSNVYGFINIPNLSGSNYTIGDVYGGYNRIDIAAGFTGVVTDARALYAAGPSIAGTGTITNYMGLEVGNLNGHGGNTSGTWNNYGVKVGSNTAAAGAGGTLNNYGLHITQPSGAGGTTNNYGIYIQGNGGGSTNYAIYSTSTAAALFSGQMVFSGVTTDITTGTNQDLTLLANGTGVINLDDSITAGGDITFAQGANRTLSVAQNTTANAAGYQMTLRAGQANGSTTGNTGGGLVLQGGDAAGSGNNNGGSVTISGGAATGSGSQGLVNLSTSAFTSAAEQAFTSSTSITAGNVDLYSSLPVKANTNLGSVLTVPDPAQSVIGRVLYISARSGSLDFTMRLNAARTPIDIAMKANSTATLIWNGTDWTAAGASSSTDLQSAYNNTLTSAGGAEIVLNASGGSADGFTIRNNGTTPINGGLLEVQSSIGTNLFSVNNRGTELADNGGAETSSSFNTDWTTVGSASRSRTTTAGQYVTGQAGVSVTTTALANDGVRNNLTANPVVSTTYQVSFTAKLSAGTFSTLQVAYSRDGGTDIEPCTSYSSQTLSTSVWTKITCTITTDSTTATNPDLIIRQTDATARTIYIDNLSFMRNDTTTQPSNVQIGGGIDGGPITLFTLDRSSAPPVANGDSTYYGSMYYDTTTGRIQCYESDGWGACGSAPDNIITLTPEYAGAVLNGSGVGTMTADFCGNGGGLSVNTTFCASGEARSYYRWTSPQATLQTYSIYVNYKLPSTFKGFLDANTIKLTAYRDDASDTNALANLEVYRKNVSGGTISLCGSSTNITQSSNSWEQRSQTGDETGCSFVAGDYVIFKINMSARNNKNVYVENLDFTFSNT